MIFGASPFSNVDALVPPFPNTVMFGDEVLGKQLVLDEAGGWNPCNEISALIGTDTKSSLFLSPHRHVKKSTGELITGMAATCGPKTWASE